MGMGSRYFVFRANDISPMSQKTFQDFFHARRPVLQKFGGQTLMIAAAYYETENRKPLRLVAIEGLRCKVLKSGAIDPKHHFRGLQLVGMAFPGAMTSAVKQGNVIDATRQFSQREYRAQHAPSVPPHVQRQIRGVLGL